MEKKLFTAAAVWTIVGMLAGVYYREFTKFNNIEQPTATQLSTVHTHALALGTLFFLVLLTLERVFHLSQHAKLANATFLVWNIGLAAMIVIQTVKGSLQVLGSAAAKSPAIAGISGLGHIALAAGFILFFITLNKALKASPAKAS